jgi:hypothetical protein
VTVHLASPAVPVGTDDSVKGTGCPPGAPVTLRSGGQVVGTAYAGPDGSFTAPVVVDSEPIGDHQIEADCGGRTGQVALVVALAQAESPPLTTLLVLLFFILLALGLLRRWLFPTRRRSADGT